MSFAHIVLSLLSAIFLIVLLDFLFSFIFMRSFRRCKKEIETLIKNKSDPQE